ncbi:interleukin-1 receptor-associated kinase 3 [Bombina bombina]|uniref:interleukin-1 receptor-associated kinase 3 n=1 Tax=Bombina bombina TaxID=8345 RepID=UPI00235AEACD|nr:interleukin-1 receptor-associated kinase 3 [Bombina bombina]
MAGSVLSFTSDTSLFEVPPSTMENFCKMMDCCDGDLGWRGLAERLSSDWMEFRKVEKYAEQGKSRTRELLWSWAQKNKTVRDLLIILQDMGHKRAIHLFINHGASLIYLNEQNQSLDGAKKSTLEIGESQTLEYREADCIPGSQHEENNQLPFMSFKMIIDGTKDFHSHLLIGEGNFFDVYKAEIHAQTRVVKVLKKDKNKEDLKQRELLLSELKKISRFKHPNILELLGYASSDEITCLVYPYLTNGSLFDKIQCTGNSFPLSWKTRLHILFGVARAIHFLHAVKPWPVICGNITSKNILLDQHFEPKLSDFAMVHLRSYLINHIYTIKMDHATLKFLGYLPEEYIRRGNLSTKTDVYSYGILMMEILTGCPAVLNGSKHTYLRDLLSDVMETGGVQSLLQFLDKKADTWSQSVADKLLSLSIQCTASRVKLRPTMEEVVERIKSYVHADHHSDDQPKSLKLVPQSDYPHISRGHKNTPVESDESQDFSLVQRKKSLESPCECSQSEVTYLGANRKTGMGKNTIKAISTTLQNSSTYTDYLLQQPDLPYSRRPFECSCSAGPDTTTCEECMSNGFGYYTAPKAT